MSNLNLGNSGRFLGYSSANWLASLIVLSAFMNAAIVMYGVIKFIEYVLKSGKRKKNLSCLSKVLSGAKSLVYRMLFVLSVGSSLFAFLQSIAIAQQ